MKARVLVILALAGSAACGMKAGGPPEIRVDRTACSHCGMLISEPAYAAAYRAPDSDFRLFDDIKCLLDAAQKEPRADALRFWFHDAASAVWIDGTDAVFVSSPSLRTPMGGGLVAYRDRAVAREGAARHQGSVIDALSDLRGFNDPGGTRASGQIR